MKGLVIHPIDEQLLLHEGIRTHAYPDTEGYWTIGVGYNVSSRGMLALEAIIGRKFTPMQAAGARAGNYHNLVITEKEALAVLAFDIANVTLAVEREWPFYRNLSPVRQKVALDMAFNMGSKARGFVGTMAAAEHEDWPEVVRHLYRSKWARQVDDGEGGRFGRADRLARMALTDEDYTQ